jgi:transposase InsO family protein
LSQAAGPRLIHRSDRGSQYASHAFQSKLARYGMTCSMSRKGNCWNNVPAKRFFKSLKYERVHGTRYATRADAVADLFDCIEVFTTGVAATPRSAATRRFSSCNTGSRISMSGRSRFSVTSLEDEIQRELQYPGSVTYS